MVDQQWVSGVFALSGVALGWVGNRINDRATRRRESRSKRQELSVALIVSAADAVNAIRVLRSTLPDTHRRIHTVVRSMTEFAVHFDEAPLRRLGRAIRPILEFSDNKHGVREYVEIVTPQLHAMNEAAVRLSLLDDQALAQASRELVDAVYALIAGIDKPEKAYVALEDEAGAAAGRFRAAFKAKRGRRWFWKRSKAQELPSPEKQSLGPAQPSG